MKNDTDEVSAEVRAAVERLGRAATEVVQAKFGNLRELSATELGVALQSGRAAISFGIVWPDMSMIVRLRQVDQPPIDVLEVTVPRVTLQ